MKANIKQTDKLVINIPKNSGPFHGHELRLTVGMIVKNEEKNLAKCLDALKPLLDAVPSELIITDTGSTDRTVEIAKQYTDHVLYFEWCGDFSAARNTGLKAARGEWFFYLDADEWLDDAAPLIDFFNSNKCDNYWSAGLRVRDYSDFSGSNYQDVYVARLYRCSPGNHFVNKIHEDLIRLKPTCYLDVFAHHYGYVYHNIEEKDRKDNRNLSLLKAELQDDPDDLKALMQIGGQLIGTDDQKAIQYLKHGMQISGKSDFNNDSHLYARLGSFLLQAYSDGGFYRELLEMLPNVLSKEAEPGFFHIECYALGQLAAWHLEQWDDVEKYGSLYLELYEDYKNENLDQETLLLGSFHFLTDKARETAIVLNGQALVKLGRNNEALSYLEQLDLSIENSTTNGSLKLCFDLASQLADWSVAAQFYSRLLLLDDNGKLLSFMIYANNYCCNYPSKGKALKSAFANLESENAWVLMCRLRVEEWAGNREQAAQILESLRLSDEMWSPCHADILWYILKEKINLEPFLSHIDASDAAAFANGIRNAHKDFADVLFNYIQSFSFEMPKAQVCLSRLLECAILTEKPEDNPERYSVLVHSYLEFSAKYVHAVFRPEVLSSADLSALPSSFRFGYYAGLALEAQQKGNGTEYLANLRAALREYPAAKDAVNFLLKCFEKELEKHDAQTDEFTALAHQVKQNIEQLIAQGDFKQAGIYTLQLAKLIPEDDDLRRYRRLTHTEPTMSELASSLPQ